MSTVTLRWANPDNLAILLDGYQVGSASNDDDFPDETPLSVTRIVAETVEGLAGAFGATVEHEGNRQ